VGIGIGSGTCLAWLHPNVHGMAASGTERMGRSSLEHEIFYCCLNFSSFNAEDMDDEPQLTPFLKKLASTGIPDSYVSF